MSMNPEKWCCNRTEGQKDISSGRIRGPNIVSPCTKINANTSFKYKLDCIQQYTMCLYTFPNIILSGKYKLLMESA